MSAALLRDLWERKRRALLKRPALGRASAGAEARVSTDGTCKVRDDGRQLEVGLAPEDGGTGGAPHPAALMRASLGAGLALGCRLWGARLGVPIAAVEVDVVCEYDVRGQLGLDDGVPAGWQRLLFDVRVASDAPEADVRRVVDAAGLRSPVLASLSSAIDRVVRLAIVRPAR
jgi:uncharacterized OsmC-like protein